MNKLMIRYFTVGIYLGIISYFMGDLDRLVYPDDDDEINNNNNIINFNTHHTLRCFPRYSLRY